MKNDPHKRLAYFLTNHVNRMLSGLCETLPLFEFRQIQNLLLKKVSNLSELLKI